eukprot:13374528-Ditylum_brightwellii.AAC.1
MHRRFKVGSKSKETLLAQTVSAKNKGVNNCENRKHRETAKRVLRQTAPQKPDVVTMQQEP